MSTHSICAPAAVRLTLRFPFWTEVFYSMTIHELDEAKAQELGIPTQATDGRSMWINAKFFKGIPLDQQVAELVHELGHKIFLHPQRRGNRDHKIWNVACVAAGTWVRMADGCMRRVEDVRGGDYVRTPAGPARVLLNTKTTKPEVMEVSLSNGCKLTCSLDHKVLTNAGFIEARSLQEGTTVIVDARAGDICSRRVRGDEPAADVGNAGDHIPAGGVDHDPQPAEPGGAYHTPGQRPMGRSDTVAPDDLGVHGRVDRRGGDDNTRAGYGAGQGVPAPGGVREQHVDSVVALAGGSRHAGDGYAQYQRQGVLQGDTFRLRDRAVVAWDAATFDYQEGTLRAAAGVHINPQRNEAEVFTHAANAADIPGGEGYQYAWITLLRRVAQAQEVFDLTTEKSCYETEGLVSHNCDFVINAMMKKNGFPIEQYGNWLLDMKYDGWVAERVYADLVKNAKENPGKPQPGVAPGREDLKDMPGTPEEIERHESEVKALVDRATAAAKAMGKLPAGIEQGAIQAFKPAREPWFNHLHRYMQTLCTSAYNWARLNRRTLRTHGIFTPLHLSEALGDIAVFTDTSGSCYAAAQQANFAGHLNAILAEARPRKVYMYDFDARVYPAGEVEAGEIEVTRKPRGGGGTDFRPIFEQLDKDGIVPDVCIILTDLQGTFPRTGPDYPVLWASIYEDETAPFGEVIYVTD